MPASARPTLVSSFTAAGVIAAYAPIAADGTQAAAGAAAVGFAQNDAAVGARCSVAVAGSTICVASGPIALFAGVESAGGGMVATLGSGIRIGTALSPAAAAGDRIEVLIGGTSASGSSSGGGSNYLGAVASAGAMTALSAVVGSECLRSDLGAGGLRYELTALPASTAGNWQALQGTLADASLVTLALVDGKLPRRLLVSVASGCQVTVTIGGVTQPVLPETVSGQYHEIVISDDPAAAQPTTLTIQRTAGSGTTSTYSLETL